MSNLHHNIIAIIYYLSGYATAMLMIMHQELYLRAFGMLIGTYITYNLVTQLDSRNKEIEDEE
jgi:hypothetical protein